MKSLTNQISIITGGTTGIGLAIAKGFLEKGIKVLVNDLDGRKFEQVKSIFINLGINLSSFDFFACDVSVASDIEKLFHYCNEKFGSCSILVNNAGIIQEKEFLDITADDWERMMAVHLRGCFLGCKYALPDMLKKGEGSIINIASQLGQIGGFELAHYAAAKAGIIGLTKSLALEYGSSGVRVNAIAPGPINTDMVLKNLTKEWREKKSRELPLGSFGDPEDVANTALFLASNASRIFIGQTLCPNSGDVML